jgi:hypothetical protein
LAFRVPALVGLVALSAVACGGPQELGAKGSVCFRADDCQAGLACVPEAKGSAKHLCSPDLSGIVSMVDGGPVGPAAGAAAVGAAGGEGALAGAGAGTAGGASADGGSGGSASPNGGDRPASAGTGG